MKEWKLSMNQTELSMTPAGDLYKEYCFSDAERPAEKACIGHLRGGFRTERTVVLFELLDTQQILADRLLPTGAGRRGERTSQKRPAGEPR